MIYTASMLTHTISSGANHLRTLVCIHGFLGDYEAFFDLFKPLASHYRVLSIALPYHHSSHEYADSMASFCEGLVELLDFYSIKDADFYGYSMGGRLSMCFAYLYPERVSTLFIESAHFGFSKQHDKQISAKSIDQQTQVFKVDTASEFLDKWYDMPLFQKTKQRLSEDSINKKRQLHLAELQQLFERFHVSTQPAVLESIQQHGIPILYFAGELDQKYVNLSQALISASAENKRFIIANADHCVHCCDSQAIFTQLLTNK